MKIVIETAINGVVVTYEGGGKVEVFEGTGQYEAPYNVAEAVRVLLNDHFNPKKEEAPSE